VTDLLYATAWLALMVLLGVSAILLITFIGLYL
jgi:hypothetical protein